MITNAERDITVIYRILKYCRDVEKAVVHFGNSFEKFSEDSVFLNAVSMPVYQVGELSNHLSDEFKTDHSDIPWSQIRGMRNLFAHEYYGMNIEKIWEVSIEDIPVLAEFCKKVIAEQEKA